MLFCAPGDNDSCLLPSIFICQLKLLQSQQSFSLSSASLPTGRLQKVAALQFSFSCLDRILLHYQIVWQHITFGGNSLPSLMELPCGGSEKESYLCFRVLHFIPTVFVVKKCGCRACTYIFDMSCY